MTSKHTITPPCNSARQDQIRLQKANHLTMTTEGIPRDYRPTVKVILVGNSGVGKTCLISSYLKNTFEPRTAQTVAPAYSCREVKKQDGTIVILQIWDTAGQERYSSISQLFFRDSNVALVCFDPNDETSILAVRDWVRRVLNEVAECHLFGVLTKADLIPSDEIEKVIQGIKVTLADVSIEAFFPTSSLTRNGVEALFQATAELYTHKGPGRPRPQPAPESSGCC
jgi:small GTP-binding protein